MILTEQANVTVMVEQHPALIWRRIEQVATEEKRLIGPSEQSENGGSHVERTAQVRNALGRFDDRGPDDEQGNFVGVNRDALAAIDARAMIGHDDENCIRVEWFFSG